MTEQRLEPHSAVACGPTQQSETCVACAVAKRRLTSRYVALYTFQGYLRADGKIDGLFAAGRLLRGSQRSGGRHRALVLNPCTEALRVACSLMLVRGMAVVGQREWFDEDSEPSLH